MLYVCISQIFQTEKLVEGLEELIKYSNTTNMENQENNLPEWQVLLLYLTGKPKAVGLIHTAVKAKRYVHGSINNMKQCNLQNKIDL